MSLLAPEVPVALQPYLTTVGFAQLTTMTTASNLAAGYDTVSTVGVGTATTAGGSGYHRGDIVQCGTAADGTPVIVYVTSHNSSGVVSGVDLSYGGSGIQSGFWLAGSTPGTANVVASNVQVQNANATGLLLNFTYSASALPQQVQQVQLQAIGQNVNWRDDGVAPTTGTTGVGNQLFAGLNPWQCPSDPYNVQVVQASTGAILNVVFQSFVGNVAQGR